MKYWRPYCSNKVISSVYLYAMLFYNVMIKFQHVSLSQRIGWFLVNMSPLDWEFDCNVSLYKFLFLFIFAWYVYPGKTEMKTWRNHGRIMEFDSVHKVWLETPYSRNWNIFQISLARGDATFHIRIVVLLLFINFDSIHFGMWTLCASNSFGNIAWLGSIS